MDYLELAGTRINARRGSEFEAAVEAFRTGAILAQDAEQYRHWRAAVTRRSGQRPEGKSLAQLVKDFGGQVTAGEFEFRRDVA